MRTRKRTSPMRLLEVQLLVPVQLYQGLDYVSLFFHAWTLPQFAPFFRMRRHRAWPFLLRFHLYVLYDILHCAPYDIASTLPNA